MSDIGLYLKPPNGHCLPAVIIIHKYFCILFMICISSNMYPSQLDIHRSNLIPHILDLIFTNEERDDKYLPGLECTVVITFKLECYCISAEAP